MSGASCHTCGSHPKTWGTYPRVVLHEQAGQKASCLAGLVRYAREAALCPEAGQFETLDDFVAWCRQQPVVFDYGEGPARSGCDPAQRSRLWPQDGLNWVQMSFSRSEVSDSVANSIG